MSIFPEGCGLGLDEEHNLYCGDGKNNCFVCAKIKEARTDFAEKLYKEFFKMEGEVIQKDIGEYDKLISAHAIKDKMDVMLGSEVNSEEDVQ